MASCTRWCLSPFWGTRTDTWRPFFSGNIRVISVILVDKRAEHLGLRRQLPRERIRAPAHELTAAHIEGLDLDGISHPVVAEDIFITLLHGRHMLLTHGFLQRLQALQETMGKQHMTSMKQRDEDIFGYHRVGDTVQIQTLNVRSGQLVGGRSYTFPRQLAPETEVLSSFINQYYADNPYIPREVLLPCELEDADSLAELLTEKKGRQVSVLVPQKGDKHHLVQLAMKNAELSYQKERDADEQQQRAIEELQDKLHLRIPPHRIECFDISNISGTLAVGSMVCFQEGQPDKQRYRRYRIQTLNGPNDYGMMLEVLRRRYRRALAENDLPDLLMVDGGKGQLNMALRALDELGITTLEVVGIAKSRLRVDQATGARRHSDEKFYRPRRKNAVIFPVNSPALFLLQRVRDEAHRFAVTYHKTLRQRQQLRSALEDIPGVGEQRKTQLLRHFGSLKQVREASFEALSTAPGMPQSVARAVYDYFHPTPGGEDEEARQAQEIKVPMASA